jgi:hypothetical protein
MRAGLKNSGEIIGKWKNWNAGPSVWLPEEQRSSTSHFDESMANRAKIGMSGG